MTKVRATYRDFSAAELKARASIPAQADIAVGANSISCNRHSLFAICDLLNSRRNGSYVINTFSGAYDSMFDSSGGPLSQSFTVVSDYAVLKISIPGGPIGGYPDFDLRLSIYNAAAGIPTTKIIDSLNVIHISRDNLRLLGHDLVFEFPYSLLTAGQYCWVLSYENEVSHDSSNYTSLNMKSGNTYAGGQASYYAHSLWVTSLSAYDFISTITNFDTSAYPYSVRSACRHDYINENAGFSPLTRSYVDSGTLDGYLQNTLPAVSHLNDFAGYNHNAPEPGADRIISQNVVNSGDTATFDAYVTLGEINFPSPAVALALTIWDGATLAGFGTAALSGAGNTILVTAQTGALTENKNFTLKLFITDSLTEFAENGANVCCIMPGTGTYGEEVTIIEPSEFIVDNGGFTVDGAGLNYSLGQVDWARAIATYDVTNLQVIARYSNYDSSETESIEMFNGPVSANTYIYPDTQPAQFNKVPIPPYGYIVRLEFNESA